MKCTTNIIGIEVFSSGKRDFLKSGWKHVFLQINYSSMQNSNWDAAVLVDLHTLIASSY